MYVPLLYIRGKKKMIRDMYYRKAKVLNVVDGDTFDAEIDLGFHINVHRRVRILGIDTPEMDTPEGEISKQALISLIGNKNITLQSVKLDSFGRSLATVYIEVEDECINVSEHMLRNKYAIIYTK